jgi:hypothetical protein
MLSFIPMPPLRLTLPKLLPLFLLILALLSCDQDLNSSQDQPTVDYVVLATDSATAQPLEGVRVRITTITGDTSSYLTSAEDGRIQLPTLASSQTRFELSRSGYASRDTVDTVNAKPDSVFHRPIPRLLRVRMRKTNETGGGRVQLYVLPRDPDLKKLPHATVLYSDSSDDLLLIADTAGNGTLGLKGLKAGKSQVLVKHPGYLGHWFETPTLNASDTGRAPSLIATLLPLGANSISGQVLQATSSGAEPLPDARVEFHLKDSLAMPDSFVTFTLSDPLHMGRFEMDSVPALDGQIFYFKDRTSTEPVKILTILRDEVLRAGPLGTVTLTIASDSSSPNLIKAPGDSVRPNDTLSFLFNQPVELLDKYIVTLVNQGELLTDTGWSGDHKALRLWLKGGKWTRGKTYGYELSARNQAGQYFTAQGDTSRKLTGIFSVPDTVGSDSVRLPVNFAFTYFNSGDDFRLGAGDSTSSPFPDSTSQYAHLHWVWTGSSGRKADSLVIWYQDNDLVSGWTRWGAVPGPLDSTSLAFSDHYATNQSPNPKSRPLPFKNDGSLSFLIIPKHLGKTYPGTTLEPLRQGMGPRIYTQYTNGSVPLKVGKGDTDSVNVEFRKVPGNASSLVDWSEDRPTPVVYYNEKINPDIAKWRWIDDKHGRVYYILPNPLNAEPVLRVDLGQEQFLGKPIWHQNRNAGFILRP